MSAPDKLDFIRRAKEIGYVKSIANCASIANVVDCLYVYDNSAENKKIKPLFRLSNGVLGKMYVEKVPEWARNILPEGVELQQYLSFS